MKTSVLYLNIAMLFFCFNCKKTPQDIYNHAIKEYMQEKNERNRARIIDYVIKSSLVRELGKKKIVIVNNTIINYKEKLIIAANGLELKLEFLHDRLLSYYDNKIFMISDGFKIDLYNMQKQLFKTLNLIEDRKITTDAIKLINNKLYYFYKRKIYCYNLDSQETVLFDKKEYSPPYKKNFFKVNLEIYNNILVICIGSAGSYNISLLDLETKNIIKKDLKAATNSFFFEKNNLYYIKGASGEWKLMVHFIKNNKSEVLNVFKNVLNLFFIRKHLVSLEKSNTIIHDYINKEIYYFFPEIELIKSVDNSLIIKYNQVYYLVDNDKIFRKLIILSRDIPAFNKKIEKVDN